MSCPWSSLVKFLTVNLKPTKREREGRKRRRKGGRRAEGEESRIPLYAWNMIVMANT